MFGVIIKNIIWNVQITICIAFAVQSQPLLKLTFSTISFFLKLILTIVNDVSGMIKHFVEKEKKSLIY